jgi:hypothetical protein
MKDTIVSDGTMCPLNTVNRPKIVMSFTCVDRTIFLSGKFIVRGDKGIHLLSMSAPSIMKMEVAPVSAMAWLVPIVRAVKYCSMGLPNKTRVVAAI